MRKILGIIGALLLGLGVALAVTGTAHATNYYQIELTNSSGTLSGYCINDPDGSSTNGTKLQLWQCMNNNEDFVALHSTFGDGNFVEIQFTNGKCLDDTNGGGNGTALQIWTCNNGGNQAFCIVNYNSTSWPVAWEVDGHAIDDYNDNYSNGNKIQLWSPLLDNSQAWYGSNYSGADAC